jgi:NAD(P)-dependent dehydrogenase (short-subunit alcohol dehydrogenase family)
MNLKNNVAVVTGGASGMGRETAQLLASQGARVVVLDIHRETVNAVAAEIGGLGLVCNVANAVEVEQAFKTIKEHWESPRICVNCAGILMGGRVVGRAGPMKLEDFTKVIEVNLIGTFNVLRWAAADMVTLTPNEEGERGVIINTASIAAFDGQIGQAAYSASKGGIVGMTLPIARELGQFGIRVMAIAPGVIATPMLEKLAEPLKKEILDSAAFPKRFGKPQEFAKMVLHIIDNILLNGSVIRLDGGIRLPPK